MTRRGNGEGSISRRRGKDGKVKGWMAQYYVQTSDGRKRKTLYGKTRTEVAAKLERSLSDRTAGRTADAGKRTVREHLEGWLSDSVKGIVKETTYAMYACACRVHINPVLGDFNGDPSTPLRVA